MSASSLVAASSSATATAASLLEARTSVYRDPAAAPLLAAPGLAAVAALSLASVAANVAVMVRK